MPEESAESNPKPESENAAKEKQPNKFKRFLPSRVVRVYIYGIFSVILLGYGQSLLGGSPKPFILAWIIIFSSICFAAAGLRLWLINHKPKHPMHPFLPNLIFLGIAGLGLCGCLYAVLHEEKEHRQHFSFTAETPRVPGSIEDTVEMTNDFLFPKINGDTILPSNVVGWLIVPISTENSNATVKFLVKNDSSTTSELSEILFTFEKTLSFTAPGWSDQPRNKDSSRIVTFKPVPAARILKNNSGRLPPFIFANVTKESFGLVVVCIRGEHFDDIILGFRIGFTTSTNASLHVARGFSFPRESTNLWLVIPP